MDNEKSAVIEKLRDDAAKFVRGHMHELVDNGFDSDNVMAFYFGSVLGASVSLLAKEGMKDSCIRDLLDAFNQGVSGASEIHELICKERLH